MSKSLQTAESKQFGIALKSLLDATFGSNRMQSRDKPLKLILHVGTPKTGTTSLQVYLDKKQRKLRKLGILYPHQSHNLDAPKHQWFEKNLVRTHPENLLDNFKQILSQVEDHTHTILLSSEGIYNHWWDFPEESKALLHEISALFEVNIWVWFREPISFAESFYKQCLRNPKINAIACYGKDLSFAEILNDSWFSQRLDYLDFINQCEEWLEKSAITAFKYQEDTVTTVSQLLGLSTPHDNPTPRQNTSMNTMTAELYRVLNRLELSAKDKEKFVPHMQALNAELQPYSKKNETSLVDDKSKAKILQMTDRGILELEKRYFKD